MDVALVRSGLMFVHVFGWYSQYDIPAGCVLVDEGMREYRVVDAVLRFVECVLRDVLGVSVSIGVIRCGRVCFFEHLGAYSGSW